MCDTATLLAPDTPPSIMDQAPRPALDAARAVPGGFAGFRRDPATKRLIIRLTDTTQGIAARDALLQSRATREDAILTAPYSREELQTARVERARWSAAQMHDWFKYATFVYVAEARKAGAVVVGIGGPGFHAPEPINVVVLDERSRAIVDDVLGRLGVPCQLVGTSLGGPVAPG